METDNFYGKEIGNYLLVEKLDCGTFGCVYRAEHLHLKQHIVAIKLIHAHLVSPQKSAEFLQEAQFLHDLSHPYILPVLDIGIYEKTIPYLVVEYCANGSLKQYLQRWSPLSRPFPSTPTLPGPTTTKALPLQISSVIRER